MPNTTAVQDVQPDIPTTIYIHKVTLTGSYVAAVPGSNVGEVIVPNSASNPKNLAKPVASAYLRGYVINGPAGFSAEIKPGADSLHWLLKLFGTTPGTELAAGAYGAGLTGDTDILVAFEARRCD